MKKKPSVIVRMGATRFTVDVRGVGTFDLNRMEKKERSAFHRELMNAFRATRGA